VALEIATKYVTTRLNGGYTLDPAKYSAIDGVSVSGVGTVTNFGTIAGYSGASVRFTNAADRLIVEAGAVFTGAVAGGGGTLDLVGGTGTNVGLIEAMGPGSLVIGKTTIANAGDLVEANGFVELALSTITVGTVSVAAGAVLKGEAASAISGATVTNAGTLVGAGCGLTITGDLGNSGLIEADKGDLTITGTGQARIGAGVLEVDGTFSENVTFADAGPGTLILGESAAFTGTILGLSRTGANQIDLKDIAYNAADTVAYSAKTGSVTVSNASGAVLATIKLKNSYAGSTFTLSDGGVDGTVLNDPRTAPFTSAMASFSAPASPVASTLPTAGAPAPGLASPHAG
jgi:hypothetical protein